MKTPLDFMRQALAKCVKERDSAKLQAKWSHEDERRISKYSGMQAAMLADVCEALFGYDSKGAPKLLAYERSSWICGPGTKTEKTWLQEWAKGWEVEPSKDWSKSVNEWIDFVEGLRVLEIK